MSCFEFVRPINGKLPTAPDAAGVWGEILDVEHGTPAAQRTVAFYASAYYELGKLRGRDELLNEQELAAHSADQEAREVVRRIANVPPRDKLEELRGNSAKAESIRDGWRRNGLLGGAA